MNSTRFRIPPPGAVLHRPTPVFQPEYRFSGRLTRCGVTIVMASRLGSLDRLKQPPEHPEVNATMNNNSLTTTFKSLLSITFCSYLLLGGSPLQVRAESPVYTTALKSTVWIVARDGEGFSTGSGVLVDRERKLVLTSSHVLAGAKIAQIVFPQFDDGEVIAERDYYVDNLSRLGVEGKVMGIDERRDLAIVEIASVPEGAKEISIAPKSQGPGDMVHSIGNPSASGGLWAYTQGTVRSLYRKKFKTEHGAHDMRILETQSPINPGDSGGPVVNNDGQLVAITHSLDREARLMSYSVDIREVRTFLAENAKPSSTGPLLAAGKLVK